MLKFWGELDPRAQQGPAVLQDEREGVLIMLLGRTDVNPNPGLVLGLSPRALQPCPQKVP